MLHLEFSEGCIRRPKRLLLAIPVCVLALTGIAYGAWTAPDDLSQGGQRAANPQVAIDPSGNAVIVWERPDASGHLRVQALRRAPDGSLSAIQTLSPSNHDAYNAQVAVDPSGDAVVVWQYNDGTNLRVQVRRRSAAGTLGVTQTPSASGQDAATPQVAVDDAGDAVLTWIRFDGTAFRAQARSLSSADVLGTTQTLSAPGQTAARPQIAGDKSGNTLVTWRRSDGSNLRIQSRARSASGTLGPTQTLSSAGQDAAEQQVAMTPTGDGAVVWRRYDGTHYRAQIRARSAAGVLSSAQTISDSSGDAITPQVAIDSSGDAVATWDLLDGVTGDGYVQERARSAGGVLSADKTLSGAGAVDPQVAIDDAGDALVVWSEYDSGTNRQTKARERLASGALGATQSLSYGGQDNSKPQVARTGTGSAVATWARDDGRYVQIQGAAGP